MIVIGIIYSIFITILFAFSSIYNSRLKKSLDSLEKENEKLKEQLKMKCKNKYSVSDNNSNAVPCYTIYECEHCKYKE